MAGCGQPAVIEQALGQRLGIHTGIDPTEQPGWRRGKAGAVALRQPDGAVTRGIEPGAETLGMAALVHPLCGWLLAVVETLAHWPLAAVDVPAFSPYVVPIVLVAGCLTRRKFVRKAD